MYNILYLQSVKTPVNLIHVSSQQSGFVPQLCKLTPLLDDGAHLMVAGPFPRS